MQDQSSIGVEEVRRDEVAEHNAAYEERKRIRHDAIRMTPMAHGVRRGLLEMRRRYQLEAMIADGRRRAAAYQPLAGVAIG